MISLQFLNEKLRGRVPSLFLLFVAVRLASVFIVQTWYVPDEYWQSLEVAHKLVFDYGYTTWEWVLGLRSYLHPLCIAVLYKIFQLFNVDTTYMLIVGPRVCQAILTAYADLKFYHWSGCHKWAAFSFVTSWFLFYAGSRTIINSFETSLTVIALSHFPWRGTEKKNDCFLWVVALLCAIRPTAAIPWLPLCLYHILIVQKDSWRSVIFKYIVVGAVTLLISVFIDSFCHGQLVLTSWQFLKLNVLHNIGSWYGVQPWHWYLSTGLPAMLGLHTLPFMFAAVQCVRHRDAHHNNCVLLSTIAFTVFIYTILPHKEFRFLMPLLPMCLYMSSDWIAKWSYKAQNLYLWIVAFVLLVSNVIPGWYLSTVHQRGTLQVMGTIADMAREKPNETSILFLMPCHSTPFYSHVHVNISMRFLKCEPNLANTPDYKDEADIFYENPNKWLHTEYPSNGTLPSHVVTFDTLVPKLTSILSRYKPVYRFHHASVIVGKRVGQYVLLHQHIDY